MQFFRRRSRMRASSSRCGAWIQHRVQRCGACRALWAEGSERRISTSFDRRLPQRVDHQRDSKQARSISFSFSFLLSSPLSACHSFLIHRTAKVARLQNMAYFSHSHRMEMRSPFTGNVCLVLINGAAVVIKQGCVYILQQRDSSNSSCVYNGERDGTLKFII